MRLFLAVPIFFAMSIGAEAAPAFYGVTSAVHTANPGVDDLVVDADPGNGEGRASYPFTWSATDLNGIGPSVTAWMAAHPDFPVAAYVAPPSPVITSDQVDAEASRRIAAVSADAVMKLQVLGTPIPDSVKSAAEAIEAKATALKAMSPIPADYASDSYW